MSHGKNFLVNILVIALLSMGVSGALASSYSPPPASGGGSGFGGDGSDGVVTKTTATQSDPYVVNSTNFSVPVSNTWTTETHGQINCTGTFTLSGTVTASPCMWGGSSGGYGSWPTYGGSGCGPAPGLSGVPYSTISSGYSAAGSGGGCGGGGGRSGVGTESTAAQGGQMVPIYPGITGSGGGAAATSSSDQTRGGKGGTRFIVAAKGAITISSGAVLNAKGGDGYGGEAGGGSGGVIGLYSETSITNDGTLNVTGGNGVSGAGIGGGGGGAGYVVLVAPTVTQNGSLVLSGGTANYTSAGAVSGASSTAIIIQAVPTLPLIAWTNDHLEELQLIANLQGVISQRQICALMQQDQHARLIAHK